MDSLGPKFDKSGYKCVPLVTENFAVRCSVDILILRPVKTILIHKDTGDLDGSIKTIFDALQIPQNEAQTGGNLPESGETPFFCLLEDDKLITEFHVQADELLALPNQPNPKPTDSCVVVQVRINHIGGGPFDRWLD